MTPNRVTIFFINEGGTKTYNEAKAVTIVDGWLVVDNGHGDIDYFPSHTILRAESRPKYYDRGS